MHNRVNTVPVLCDVARRFTTEVLVYHAGGAVGKLNSGRPLVLSTKPLTFPDKTVLCSTFVRITRRIREAEHTYIKHAVIYWNAPPCFVPRSGHGVLRTLKVTMSLDLFSDLELTATFRS